MKHLSNAAKIWMCFVLLSMLYCFWNTIFSSCSQWWPVCTENLSLGILWTLISGSCLSRKCWRKIFIEKNVITKQFHNYCLTKLRDFQKNLAQCPEAETAMYVKIEFEMVNALAFETSLNQSLGYADWERNHLWMWSFSSYTYTQDHKPMKSHVHREVSW